MIDIPRTTELFVHMQRAKRSLALRLWRTSLDLIHNAAYRHADPMTMDVRRSRGFDILEEAKALYDEAEHMDIPRFSNS